MSDGLSQPDYTQGMTNTPIIPMFMVNRNTAQAPRYEMPVGYHMRFYRKGDVATWVRIQAAAEKFSVPSADDFAKSMPGDDGYLAARVMFLVDPAGDDVGTITAWDDSGLDGTPMGHIHWVAIVPAAQGRGLGKPMMSAALEVMCRRGDTAAWLETHNVRIPALNLYLQLDFAPYPRNDVEREAWRAVAPALRRQIQV